MKLDLSSPTVVSWLGQFASVDQPTAAELLSSITLVGADQLASRLTSLIQREADKVDGPVGLYAERHIRIQNDRPDRIFSETGGRRNNRAFGHGPAPVPAGRPWARETGSEGTLATLITGLVRSYPKKFLDHPGPNQIRRLGIRTILIVTDFIGSGKRTRDNIGAFWRVRSVRSWWSYHLIRFVVVSYSGTSEGLSNVKAHPSMPTVCTVRGCPTLHLLPGAQRSRLIDLCSRYGPAGKDKNFTRLGFGGAAALLAFDHGAPNNMPLLLHGRTRKWIPLFSRRSAANVRDSRKETLAKEEIGQRLLALRETALAAAPKLAEMSMDQVETVLVLASLKRRPRNSLVVSARTGISVAAADAAIERAIKAKLLDGDLKPTARALSEFAYLRRHDRPKPPIIKTNESLYYPTMLRRPRRSI